MSTAIANLPTKRLEKIAAEVGTLSTKMVKDAYRIGALLNEAREVCGSDLEFGRFRSEHIEPLGISRRTAARMSQMARAFESEAALPENVNLSVLYILTSPSTSPRAQDAVLERIEAGETVSTRDAEGIVAGINNATRRNRKDGADESPAEARERVRREAARRGPVVVDNDTGAPVEPEVDSDFAWADNIVNALRNKSPGPRSKRLAALLHALREKGMLKNLDACTVSVNFREGVIEVGE